MGRRGAEENPVAAPAAPPALAVATARPRGSGCRPRPQRVRALLADPARRAATRPGPLDRRAPRRRSWPLGRRPAPPRRGGRPAPGAGARRRCCRRCCRSPAWSSCAATPRRSARSLLRPCRAGRRRSPGAAPPSTPGSSRRVFGLPQLLDPDDLPGAADDGRRRRRRPRARCRRPSAPAPGGAARPPRSRCPSRRRSRACWSAAAWTPCSPSADGGCEVVDWKTGRRPSGADAAAAAVQLAAYRLAWPELVRRAAGPGRRRLPPRARAGRRCAPPTCSTRPGSRPGARVPSISVKSGGEPPVRRSLGARFFMVKVREGRCIDTMSHSRRRAEGDVERHHPPRPRRRPRAGGGAGGGAGARARRRAAHAEPSSRTRALGQLRDALPPVRGGRRGARRPAGHVRRRRLAGLRPRSTRPCCW